MKLHRLAVATLMATAAMAAHAELTVSPMVGYHVFDNDNFDTNSDLRDDYEASFALGYRVVPNVGVELRYAQSNPLSRSMGEDVRYEAATLDAYYRFNADSKLQPYVLVGGGLDRGTGNGGGKYAEHTIANAAVGAFYQLTDNLALRGELRGVEDMQESDHDGIASLGVLYGFGAKKAAAVAPAVVAPVVDGDDDQDGVANSVDKCPGTPRNLVVDENGCPKVLTETVTKEIRVLFDTNKSVVKAQYNGDIEAVAKLLTDYPTAKVEIQGHTDSRGSAGLNDKLSQSRADAVAKVLSDKYGIAADRIASKGYGASQPVADNKTVDGRAQNRRTVAVAAGEVKVTVKK